MNFSPMQSIHETEALVPMAVPNGNQSSTPIAVATPESLLTTLSNIQTHIYLITHKEIPEIISFLGCIPPFAPTGAATTTNTNTTDTTNTAASTATTTTANTTTSTTTNTPINPAITRRSRLYTEHCRKSVLRALTSRTMPELLATRPAEAYEFAQMNIEYVRGRLSFVLGGMADAEDEYVRIKGQQGGWKEVDEQLEGLFIGYGDAVEKLDDVRRRWPADYGCVGGSTVMG